MTKLIISQEFKNTLKCMGDNKLAHELLLIENKEFETLYSYIDISENDDIITFMPTSKLKKVLEEKPDEYKVIENGRYLKPFSSANNKMFDTLGYDPGEKRNRSYYRGADNDFWSNDDDYDYEAFDGYDESYIPKVGIIGTIVSEAVGEVSGNTYCLFRYNNGREREIVINKIGLESAIGAILWKTNRNSIKIGRFIRSIFNGVLETNSKDIEDFVNRFKAAYAMEKDELKKFDIVSGDDIKKWYKKENYLSGGGPLNNSCMASVDPSFFDIYVENARMVVLYTKGGHISDGKYTSDKIRGRAILWNDVTLNGEAITFMDRVYTTLDCDVELFRILAKENGWWYKKNQSMETNDDLTNGDSTISNPELIKKMSCLEYENYPFMDTLCYISKTDKVATNLKKYSMKLRSTGGGYETDDDYDEDYYDDDFYGDDD